MINKLKVYESANFNPYYNLATEEFLLESLEKDTLILFLWQNENTVVIGRNQNPFSECDLESMKANNCKLARRKSGGGAVFHDIGNLNFTFIANEEDLNVKKNLEIIKKACNLAGIEAEVSGRNDITANGRKFSGNAFFNSNKKCFHHGTIMIDTDRKKMSKYLTPPEAKLLAKGVKSVRSRVINLIDLSPAINAQKMKCYMKSALEESFKIEYETMNELSPECLEHLKNEYANEKWILGNTPPFSASFKGHFSWGSAELFVDVEKNIIKSVKFYTDSLDHGLSEKIQISLLNMPFKKESLKAALPDKLADDIISMISI